MGDGIVSDKDKNSGFDVGEISEVLNEKRVTRRDVLKGAAAVGAVAAFGSVASACGSSSSESSASPSASAASGPKKGGALRVGIGGGSAKDTLDAQISTTETQIDYQFLIYDSLMGWDPEHKIVMLLAEEYSPNADGSVHTVKLKSGLTFHDGSPVNADAVVYSFNRILDPKTAAAGKDQLKGLTASGIKKIDDLTVEFTLDKPNVIFYEALAYYNNAVVPIDYAPKGADGAIGSGPWVVTSFSPGQQLELKANPDYFGDVPYLDTLTLISFADPTAKLNALLGGTVDYMTLLDSAQVGTMQATPGFKVLEAKTGGWNPFTMRVDTKPFDDEKVRQAFRLIVDRQQMIDQAKGGYSWLGNDMYSPFDPGYAKDLPQRVQDLEQAKSLLKSAGYDNNLTVELICSTATGAGDVQAAQVFAQQAKGAGVKVNVKQVDPSVFYGDDYLKWVFAMDFWGYRNYLPQASIGSYPGGVWNETHWDDPEWIKLYDEAMKTVDDTKRNELITQASTIEYDKGGYIIYQFNKLLDAYTDKLGGAIPDNWGAEAANKLRFNLMYFV
jgi:peptide/nickel transport system substrate-binding protein